MRIIEDERAMGIEPTAFSLARRRSTGELRPREIEYSKFKLLAQDFVCLNLTFDEKRRIKELRNFSGGGEKF